MYKKKFDSWKFYFFCRPGRQNENITIQVYVKSRTSEIFSYLKLGLDLSYWDHHYCRSIEKIWDGLFYYGLAILIVNVIAHPQPLAENSVDMMTNFLGFNEISLDSMIWDLLLFPGGSQMYQVEVIVQYKFANFFYHALL